MPTIGEDKYWYMQLLAKYQHFFHKSTSAELQHTAFSKNNELLKPTEVLPYKKLSTTFSEKRANSIINYVSKFPNFIDFQLSLRDILSQLSFSQPANKFEHAVEEIGKLLGFQSQRPDKSFDRGLIICGVMTIRIICLSNVKVTFLLIERAFTKARLDKWINTVVV